MSEKSSNEQVIEIEVDDVELKFSVTRPGYNGFINKVSDKNKVAPAHNFLVMSIDEEQKESLMTILKDNPGAEIQIAGALIEEYVPDLDIVVKKRKRSPSK